MTKTLGTDGELVPSVFARSGVPAGPNPVLQLIWDGAALGAEPVSGQSINERWFHHLCSVAANALQGARGLSTRVAGVLHPQEQSCEHQLREMHPLGLDRSLHLTEGSWLK
jgi:hypothetical protein